MDEWWYKSVVQGKWEKKEVQPFLRAEFRAEGVVA